MPRISLLISLFFLLMAPTFAQSSDFAKQVVAAPDRSEDDRKSDEKRKPALMIDFAGVKPGMTVLDLMTGGGYSAELLARAVGPTGKIYVQEPPGSTQKAHDTLQARLKGKAMANAVLVETRMEAPLPAGVKDIDVATFILNYHDLTYLPVDREMFNHAVFAALKSGGSYIIIDHAAKAGDGVAVGKLLHRIEPSSVIAEVTAAGFVLDSSSDFLRQPNDAHDQPFFRMDSPSDQFALKFKKP
jgi:predicted methyltransferase